MGWEVEMLGVVVVATPGALLQALVPGYLKVRWEVPGFFKCGEVCGESSECQRW